MKQCVYLGSQQGWSSPWQSSHLLQSQETEAIERHLPNEGQNLGVWEQFPKNPPPSRGEAGTRPTQSPTPAPPACRPNPSPAWCHFSMGLWRWRFTSGV